MTLPILPIPVKTQADFLDSRWPIEVDFSAFIGDNGRDLLLSVEEAKNLAEDLIVVVERIIEETTSYVQVKFDTYSRKYTYRDPSGTLQVGDLVQPGPVSKVATVVALGRGNWTGPVKDIVARLDRVDLS